MPLIYKKKSTLQMQLFKRIHPVQLRQAFRYLAQYFMLCQKRYALGSLEKCVK
jgi:hypothetical protein